MPPVSLPRVVSEHKFAVYGLLSATLAGSAVVRAFQQYSNFYSAAVYLSRSAASVLALANLGFFLTLIFGRIMQRIFFGPLRTSEVERLYDRIWYFLTESLLAFTIFRDEFDTPFILMFGGLLFLKSFHWILGDRIEWMDQIPYPGPPTSFHIRTNLLFLVLWTCDLAMLSFAIDSIFEQGIGGIVLFGNEYAILAATLINYMLRYIIVTYDVFRARRRGGENAPPWQDKSMYIFYTELFTDFLKLLTYMAFFITVLTFYGLPLNIMRDVYMTTRSFVTRVRDLVRYRSATRNMDARYPDATAAEMDQMGDRTCIICRDDMIVAGEGAAADAGMGPGVGEGAPVGVPVPGGTEHAHAHSAGVADGPNMTPKKLPCGHVFHFQCLRSWLERQQSCPTCRRTVLDPAPSPTPPAGAPAAPVPGAQPQPPAHAHAQGPINPANPAAPGAPPNLPLPLALPQLMWQFGLGAMDAAPGGLPAQMGFAGWGNGFAGAGAGGQAQPNGPQQTPAPTPTTPGATAAEPQDPADPRRAAAEAALRRFGASGAGTPTPGASGSSQPIPTPTRTTTSAGTHAPPLQRFPSTPALIPLFSPSSVASLPPLAFSSHQLPIASASSSSTTSTSGQGTLDPSRLSVAEIDDSLRTLERLQGAVWGTVEELVRARSRLSALGGLEGELPGPGRGEVESGREGREQGGREERDEREEREDREARSYDS